MLKITHKTNQKAKRLIIKIESVDKIIVVRPRFVSQKIAQNFLYQNKEKIEQKLEKIKKTGKILPKHSQTDYKKNKLLALELAENRLNHFNRFYGFEFNRITIKSQKTCWGSCSAKKNLNFNYRLIHLPPSLADYIIVHELCHLQELNHSQKFWKLVSQTIPDYGKIRKELKKYSLS